MKIYLFLKDKVIDFSLPSIVEGVYSFDENNNADKKLINIEAKNGEWYLYSTNDVSISSGNMGGNSVKLESCGYYVLTRDDIKYLIYVINSSDNKFLLYSYNKEINLMIGSTGDFNVQYSCSYLSDSCISIKYENDVLVCEVKGQYVYLNNTSLSSKGYINPGDELTVLGLKFYFMNNMLLVNNPGKMVNIFPTTKLSSYQVKADLNPYNGDIKDRELYDKNTFFSKSPRIRRSIVPKTINISDPPNLNPDEKLPIILTLGPMMTMGFSSVFMLMDDLIRLKSGQTTIGECWSSLASEFAMLLSMFFWPLIIDKYESIRNNRRIKRLNTKYSKYLDDKRKELEKEVVDEKSILIDNLVDFNQVINTLNTRGINFWNKRVEDNDFLTVRVGVGRFLTQINIDGYKKEDFKEQEAIFDKKIDDMCAEYKYIDNVPIGYSLYENKVTAVMCSNSSKSVAFVKNILLQLFTYYSYEDLKIVVFTSNSNYDNWSFIKYLNHNFSNDKDVRFFSIDYEGSLYLSNYLNEEISKRKISLQNSGNENSARVKPHYLIITDDYDSIRDQKFIDNAFDNDNLLGISMVILESKLGKLPNICNSYINLDNNPANIIKSDFDNESIVPFHDEINYSIDYMKAVNILANIPIEFDGKISQLPESITFLEMEKVGKVEQLNILNRWNSNDSTTSLKAEIGVNDRHELMYLDLHEKYHGPHGLIAGTTGSGKSEFIITYILSMCINYSPYDVSFVLIDYKGGGLALAFENRLNGKVLPHLAGTITNLDKAEMNRTLVSIDSEVKKRQKMFNEARDILGDSTIDIYKYQTYFKQGKLKEPISHLFIICDEFAELKSQQPDFMDNLISIARIGRSLGVHLILATQKPSGVVDDQIWSNTKFRVCLKVQNEDDSSEMLKKPDAAHLVQAGRFYLQVGYDEIFELGQSGWGGAKYYPSNSIIKEVDKSINYIDDCGRIIKSYKEDSSVKVEAQGEQLGAIMTEMIRTATSSKMFARKLWLDNVPNIVLVNDLESKYNYSTVPYNVCAVLGEYDAPEIQYQGIVIHNYLENGNTVVYSQDSSDSEMFINSLLYSTSLNHLSTEVNFYMIDYGSEYFSIYNNLPHLGDIIVSSDVEKYQNFIKMLSSELNYRKKLFINYGGNYTSFIKSSKDKLPIITVIINNYDAFIATHDEVNDIFPQLMRDSSRYGIVFIFNCVSSNALSLNMSQLITTTYAFKIKDSSDYSVLFNSKNNLIPKNLKGRGIMDLEGLHEFQTASLVPEEDNLDDFIRNFINEVSNKNEYVAPGVPILPSHVRINTIKDYLGNLSNLPIGLNKETLEVVKLNLAVNHNMLITASKYNNMKNFCISLLNVFRYVNNSIILIVDSEGRLGLDNKVFPNYYTDVSAIGNIKNYINKLIEENSNINVILMINDFLNLNTSSNTIDEDVSYEDDEDEISDNVYDEEDDEDDEDVSYSDDVDDSGESFIGFLSDISKYKYLSVIMVSEFDRIQEITYEDSYSKLLKESSNIWVGKGIGNQSLINTDSITYESGINLDFAYPNDIGFMVMNDEFKVIKLIDFFTEDDDDE